MSAKRANFIGWLLEKCSMQIFFPGFALLFLCNKLLLYFTKSMGSTDLELWLYRTYEVLISSNLGTITTIAAIFVGIYMTVLSVLGSVKVNSVMAFLSDLDLKKLVNFIVKGMLSSFIVVFYSLIANAIEFEFLQVFVFFLLLIWMFSAALRFGGNLALIYKSDLERLSENIEQEREEAEEQKEILKTLRTYLRIQEEEKLKIKK
ncbi:hypothetical protein [Saccharibacillus brassicae]|uniref:Uncharacterized protein n=1 Tax=Saccharibacillus brassicae TaxID=2583377 RepID=A0A4Y6V096_SACBS|nr:hypothetical protein [Saccharibacillus brassicae]QDH23439.1 hypothetical protein FFV09_22780 [Saccharibacillus brassicae]